MRSCTDPLRTELRSAAAKCPVPAGPKPHLRPRATHQPEGRTVSPTMYRRRPSWTLNPVVVSPGGWAVVDLKLRLAPSSVDIDRATLRMVGGDSAVNFAARLSATSESKVPAG